MNFLKLTTIIFSCLPLIGCIHKKLPNEFSVNFEECCIKSSNNKKLNDDRVSLIVPVISSHRDYKEYNKFCNYKMVILYKLYYSKFK